MKIYKKMNLPDGLGNFNDIWQTGYDDGYADGYAVGMAECEAETPDSGLTPDFNQNKNKYFTLEPIDDDVEFQYGICPP